MNHDDAIPDLSPCARPAMPGWPGAMAKPLAAAYVGMSERWIDSAVSAGGFPRPIKLGRAARWRRADLDGWLMNRTGEQAGADGGRR